MTVKYLFLVGLVLAASCGKTPQERAQALAGASLKMVRYEHLAAAGEITLEGAFKGADELFLQTVELDPDCVRTWVKTGEGPCKEKIESFLEAAGGLNDPAREDDPAAVIVSVLRKAPESSPQVGPLITGYAAAFQMCLEVERDGTVLQDFLPFLAALGCPLTFRDLGLDSAPRHRLEELAAQASASTGKMPYSTGEFEYFITLVKLDSWGSKFKLQVTADTLAARLMESVEFREILPGLKALQPVRLGFLGDSQMDPIHWSTQGHFPEIVAAVLRKVNPSVTVINAGRGGDDSGEALARLEQDLLSRKPELSFVMLGGNDARHWGGPEPAVTPAQYRENITAIVKGLRKAGSRVVLLSYPVEPEMSGADLEVFLKIREELAAVRDSLNTGWIDVASLFDGPAAEELFAVDRIHFNSLGHRKIAGKILAYLSRMSTDPLR